MGHLPGVYTSNKIHLSIQLGIDVKVHLGTKELGIHLNGGSWVHVNTLLGY